MSYLGNTKETSGVTKLPVTELMSENGNDFIGFRLFNQCIVNDNVLLPR